jgi:hypothetical protein
MLRIGSMAAMILGTKTIGWICLMIGRACRVFHTDTHCTHWYRDWMFWIEILKTRRLRDSIPRLSEITRLFPVDDTSDKCLFMNVIQIASGWLCCRIMNVLKGLLEGKQNRLRQFRLKFFISDIIFRKQCVTDSTGQYLLLLLVGRYWVPRYLFKSLGI